MFVGREAELKKFNQMYRSDQFEFVVMYGRRRVGKTTLINEFCKDKKTIFYAAAETTEKENLEQFSRCVLKFSTGHEGGFGFHGFADLFNYLDELSQKQERIVLVIDEFPYLAASCPAISSMLQNHIDHIWQHTRLFLILCGSSMSFMEHQVLGYKSPLYGRRTAQMKLRPFTYFEARKMLSEFAPEEQAVLYGVTGGIPEYLSRIQPLLSMDDNLIQLFFDESGRLYEEPSNLLKQELREPATYHSIISAIAQGASKLNEIATKVGIETSAASAFLNSLISLGLVKKERPVTEPINSRKTIYLLEDQMFRFWYRFVSPNISNIVWGMGDPIYQQVVKPQLNDYMGLVFEEMCKQYLYQPECFFKAPFLYQKVGRWWGTNPREKCQEEIDILVLGEQNIMICECKWHEKPVSSSVIHEMKARGALFPQERKSYVLFAKNGGSQEAMKLAEQDPSVRIVSFSDMNLIG